MEKKKNSTVVECAKKRFKQAEDYYRDSRDLSTKDLLFVFGDGDNLNQWPEQVAKSRLEDQRVMLTVNITAQHCNQIINNIRMNRPQGQVLPLSGGATSDSAEVMEDFIRSLQSVNNADDSHDHAMEQTVYAGEGYWRLYVDYVADDSFEKTIRIRPVNDFNAVYIDPNAKLPDKSDAKWGFIVDRVSREQFEAEYPKLKPSNWESEDIWVTKDEITIAEYWYCDLEDDELERYADKSVGYKSQNESGLQPIESRPVKREVWKWCKLAGGEEKPLEEEDWLINHIGIVGAYGKKFSMDGKDYVKGLVRDLKDPARMVNMSYSSAVEAIALAPKAPFIAPVEATDGRPEWDDANKRNYSVLKYHQYNPDNQPLEAPRRSEQAQIPAAHLQMLQVSTEEMRAASGQSAANFGVKSEASSGVGIQRLKAQGEVATFHYPDNLARALRYEMQLLIELIPNILDEGQVIRTLGVDGTEKKVAISYNIAESYRESPNNEYAGIFNPAIGKYDVAISTGPSYQTQRAEAAQNQIEMARANPAIWQTHGDLIVKSQDWPMAEEFSKRFKKMLPPQLQEQDENDQSPEAMQQQAMQMQQQMQEMDAALKGASQHMQELQQQIDEKDAALMQEQAKRITSEIQAKQASSLLAIEKASRSLIPQPAPNSEGGDEEIEDEEEMLERDPQMDQLLWSIEENAIQQKDLMTQLAAGQAALLEQLSRPRVSKINVHKNPDGTMTGEKIEEGV